MSSREPLPGWLLEAIGRPVVAEDASEVYRLERGERSLALRRDCVGVLRQVEVTFPARSRDELRERLARQGAGRCVVPGALDVFEISGVGRLSLAPERLTLSLRQAPLAAELTSILTILLDAEV